MPKRSKIDPMVLDLMDALTSPVLTHSIMWKDVLPERLLEQVTTQRLISLMKHEEYANDLECVIFIYTRTLEAPMHGDWVEIYTHLGCKVEKELFGRDCFDQVQAPKELTEYQQRHLLLPLRQHIYKKRREILKQRIRADEQEIDKEELARKAQKIMHEGEQLQLWDLETDTGNTILK